MNFLKTGSSGYVGMVLSRYFSEKGTDIEGYLTIGTGILAVILVLMILTILTRMLLVRSRMRKIWIEKPEEPKTESDQTIDSGSEPNQ